MIVPSQFWFLYPEPEAYAAVHGSPCAYDTHVPILLAGPGISPKVVSRAVALEDLAPTVASYLQIKLPSGSAGGLRDEVLERCGAGSLSPEPIAAR